MLQNSALRNLGTGLLVVALLLPGLSCKAAPEPLPATPFSSDYKLDKTNVGFFTGSDSIEMLLSGSPFYTPDQPLPGQKTDAYEKARAKKVDEIKREAQSLVNLALKLKPRLDEVRGALLTHLQSVRDADPRLDAFATAIMAPVQSLATQEAILEGEYDGTVADRIENAFAGSFMDYMKVANAVDLGGLYLRDTGSLAGYAALALTVLGTHDNPSVKKANEKLDQDMKALDGLGSDARDIAASMQKINYGLKQLFTGSYYFTRAANDFVAGSLRDLEAAADRLTPREGLTRDDIWSIQTYLALFERWQYQVKRQADSMDKSRLVRVSALHGGNPGAVYAAAPPGNYASAVSSLLGPLRADEAANKKSTYFTTGWAAARKALGTVTGVAQLQALQRNIGVAVDVAKLVEDTLINATFGRYYFNIPADDIRQDIRRDWKAVQENFRNNMSGSDVLKAAGGGLQTAEEAAGKAAAAGARAIGVQDEWMASAIGGAAKLTVGLYTGLVKNMYTLANQQSTAAETGEALLGVALAATGGSKTVLAAPMLKSAEEKMAANASLAFVNSVMARQDLEREALKVYLREGKAAADAYVRENAAREAVARALQQSSEKILANMERLSKGGLASFSRKVKDAAGESFHDLFKKNFELSLSGIRDALRSVAGNNDWEYALNLLGALGDEQITKSLVKLLGEGAVRDIGPKPKTTVSAPGATPRPPAGASPKPPAAPGAKPPTAPGTKPPASPGPKPPAGPAPKPTLTPVLSAARDLTGTWKGTGAYYQLDTVSGQRARKITVDVTAELQQRGDAVTGWIEATVVKREPEGVIKDRGRSVISYEGWVAGGGGLSSYETETRVVGDPRPLARGLKEKSRWRYTLEDPVKPGTKLYWSTARLQGTASVTNLYLQTQTADLKWKWEFSFTTDLMSGGLKEFVQGSFTRYEGNKYDGMYESDPKGFSLTRQK